MTNASIGTPMLRYAAVNKLMTGGKSRDCSYQGMIKAMKKTSWKDSFVKGGGMSYGVCLMRESSLQCVSSVDYTVSCVEWMGTRVKCW